MIADDSVLAIVNGVVSYNVTNASWCDSIISNSCYICTREKSNISLLSTTIPDDSSCARFPPKTNSIIYMKTFPQIHIVNKLKINGNQET